MLQRSIQQSKVLDYEQRDKTSICSGGLYLKIAIHVNPMLDKPRRGRYMKVNGGRSNSKKAKRSGAETGRKIKLVSGQENPEAAAKTN